MFYYRTKPGLVGFTSGHGGIRESTCHTHRVAGYGYCSIYEHGIGTQFHGFRCMGRSAKSGIHYHRYTALLYYDLEKFACHKPLV